MGENFEKSGTVAMQPAGEFGREQSFDQTIVQPQAEETVEKAPARDDFEEVGEKTMEVIRTPEVEKNLESEIRELGVTLKGILEELKGIKEGIVGKGEMPPEVEVEIAEDEKNEAPIEEAKSEVVETKEENGMPMMEDEAPEEVYLPQEEAGNEVKTEDSGLTEIGDVTGANEVAKEVTPEVDINVSQAAENKEIETNEQNVVESNNQPEVAPVAEKAPEAMPVEENLPEMAPVEEKISEAVPVEMNSEEAAKRESLMAAIADEERVKNTIASGTTEHGRYGNFEMKAPTVADEDVKIDVPENKVEAEVSKEAVQEENVSGGDFGGELDIRGGDNSVPSKEGNQGDNNVMSNEQFDKALREAFAASGN